MLHNTKTILYRYFFREIARSVLLLLGIFYSLYIVVDLMAHLKELRMGHIYFFTWIQYYLCIFSRRLDILLPFAIMLGTIRTLLMMQARNELVALLASGISFKKLLQPLLIIASFAALILYCNYQWLYPITIPRASYIAQSEFGKEIPLESNHHLNEIALEDTSRMVYRAYDPIVKQFQDVFWIRSCDEIYHIKALSCDAKSPTGRYVDKLLRNKDGFLEKADSWEITSLQDMRFDETSLKNSITPAQEQSLTQLCKQIFLHHASYSDRVSELKCHFFYKLCFPFLCILAFISPAPFCLQFRRQIPIFMIYVVSIAVLFCLVLVMQASFTLAKSNMVPAWLAIGLPWLAAVYYFGKKYLSL